MVSATYATKTKLGRTGLDVSRLVVSSGYGVGARGFEVAREAGVNFFHLGRKRDAGFMKGLGRAAKEDREGTVVALQAYARAGALLARSVEKALTQLDLDYLDLLILGYWQRIPYKGVQDVALRLKQSGKVRFVGIAGHNRPKFDQFLEKDLIDVFMVRYNPAHRGAEAEVFAGLPERDGPGVMAYTATRWGHLLDPSKMPEGERAPKSSDCYRFALSHPRVDVVHAAPKNTAQMREALATLELGPLSPDEQARMERIGDHLYRKHKQIFY